MENRPAILKTKLRLPKVPGTINREHLLPVLSAIAHKKTAIVVAGAGYGKTTLIAQTVELSGMPAVWYSLDETDLDLSVFMTYLVTGIRQYYPNFGQHLLDQTGIISSSDRSRKSFLISLLAEIENTLSKDLVIVLDDYYSIQDNPSISDSLSFLLNRLPPQIHFVIISRSEPDIQLSRLRAMSEVIDIGENDLEFKLDEVKTLYNQVLKLQLTEQQLQKVRNRTEGWPAGLILFYHSIKGVKLSEIDFALDRLGSQHKTLRSYFEENVFDKLNPEIQDFLLKTSILTSMTVEFCNAFLGINNSAHILSTLEKSHLFTFCSREERPCYAYHHLLKDFLEQKLKQQIDGANLEALHCLAGDLLYKTESFEEALLHYLEGNDNEQACRLFLELAIHLFMVGRLKLIQLFYDKIPQARINHDPKLLLLKARLVSLNGKPNDAIEILKSGLKIVSRSQSKEQASWFQKELGVQFYYSGDIPGAIAQFRNVLSGEKPDPQTSGEAAGMLAFLLSVQGEFSEAERILKFTQDFVNQLDGELKQAANAWIYMCLSFKNYCTGDFVKSKLFALDGLRIIEKLKIDALLPLAFLQLSYADVSLGNFEAANKSAGKGIDTAIKLGINDSFLAWLHIIVGQAKLGQNCPEEALEAALVSLDLFQNIGNKWGMATSHDLLSRIYLQTEKHREADHHLELGYEAIKGQQLPLTRGFLDYARILLLIKQNRTKAALNQIQQTQTDVCPSKHLTCVLLLLQAGLYIKTENSGSAIKPLQKGLQIAVENNYPVSSFDELRPIWLQLMELKSHEAIRTLWNQVMGDGKMEPVGIKPGSTGSTGFPELRVECFGRFRVFKGGNEIPVENWKSSKTEQLFKYLVAKADRGYIPRDILIEILWPNETATKCVKRLNVAFTTLRNFLEPERKPGGTSNYILRQKDAYRIDLGEKGTTDVLEFIQAVTDGEAAIQRHSEDPGIPMEFFLKAASIRKGDFLENDLYLDWCTEERERLNQVYFSVLQRIIDFYENKGDHLQGLRFADKALTLDPYAEEIYRKIMVFYSGAGNNPMILKTYEKCRFSLEKELNCPLSRETIDLFNRLTQSHQ
ncbi:hypothetical protein KJ966_09145 [bacterium]|nr:hypothetical protein [bacterium]